MLNTSKLNLLASALLAVTLAACSGDDGRDGAVGPAGAAGAAGADGANGADGADGANGADGQDANAALSLKLVGTTPALAENFDESAAEIVAYHAGSKTAFLVNSNSKAVDVVSLEDMTAPTW